MARVYIAGIGLTKVAEHWGKSLLDLAVEAGLKALNDAGSIEPEQVIVANMLSSISSKQEHLGAFISDGLGLEGRPAFKVEAAGASGGVAVHVGYNHLKAGEVDSVLVVGVEKTRDIESKEIAQALSMAESYDFTQFFGVSFTAMNAMLTRLYMQEFDVSRDELSAFPVIAHQNALTSPHAQFRKAITVEDVAKSMPVSDPIRLLDCAPIGEGSAALLLVSDKKVDEIKGPYVEILSSVVRTNRFNLYEREDILDFTATRKATQRALASASIRLEDIDFVEVHDVFSVSAALAVEAIGLSKRGMGAKDAKDGKYGLKGETPINTFGGLKGRGDPIGATGVYQLAEAYLQLTGNAGPNQVKDAKNGLIHSMGGIDTTSVVHIVRRAKD